MKTHIINFCIKSTFIFLFCFLFSVANLFANSNDWQEVKKLIASDVERIDRFGTSVAIAGDVAIVGAARENYVGAAYIFEKNVGGPNAWREVKKLTASDASGGDDFGHSVDIAGDVVIVGAPFNYSVTNLSGAAYIFERNVGGPNAWGEVIKLTASDAAIADYFGFSVAIVSNYAIVGAYDKYNTMGSYPDGAAYIFERTNVVSGKTWKEVKKLISPDNFTCYRFGTSVSIAESGALVGASGVAFLFKPWDNWNESITLTTSCKKAYGFGESVAIDGDIAIVGARTDNSISNNAGAAYIFLSNTGGPGVWGEKKQLIASDLQEDNRFGWSVDVDGNIVVVGTYDGSLKATQAAYVFDRNSYPTNWAQIKKLTASDTEIGDFFGNSVAVAGDVIIVGAFLEGSLYTNEAGAVYVFSVLGSLPSETFDNAPDLTANSGIAVGSNIDATIESGEPAHAGNGGPYHSVWWDWSEPTAASEAEFVDGDTLLVDTHGSDFDTVLAIYTGSAVNNLTQIAANDNAGTGIETSEVTFQFNPGVTYHIAVDGKTASDTGNVVLNYAIIPEPCFYFVFIICNLLFINGRGNFLRLNLNRNL